MPTHHETSSAKSALRCALAPLVAVLCFVSSAAFGADAAQTKEYQIKAAFVLNFAKFLEWPESRFASNEQPIAIGVVGQSPLTAELQAIVKGRKVRGRNVTVKNASTLDDVQGVHLLFVGAARSTELALIKTAAESAAVLTIGESPEFEAAGGMITFLIEGDKVRFAINMGAAEQAHLKISAQLQQLATAVHR